MEYFSQIVVEKSSTISWLWGDQQKLVVFME
jgi:hypothetical protein